MFEEAPEPGILDPNYSEWVVGKFFAETLKEHVIHDVSGLLRTGKGLGDLKISSASCSEEVSDLADRMVDLMMPHLLFEFKQSPVLCELFGFEASLDLTKPGPELDAVKKNLASYMIDRAVNEWMTESSDGWTDLLLSDGDVFDESPLSDDAPLPDADEKNSDH